MCDQQIAIEEKSRRTSHYRVLDSSGLGFCLDFTGLELEYVAEHQYVPDYLVLRQPAQDRNGRACCGWVCIDLDKLEPVEPDPCSIAALS